MERKTTSPIAKLCMLALALALILPLAPAWLQDAVSTHDPCPHACGYTWDPVERCCVAAPWSDCPDRCF